MSIKTNNTTQMTVLANGNVGIGTTTPSGILHLEKNQNTNTTAYLKNPNSGNFALAEFDISSDTGALYLGAGSSTLSTSPQLAGRGYVYSLKGLTLSSGAATDDIRFYSNYTANELVRITGAGNVGIGTTSPQALLDVNGYARLKSYSSAPVACAAGNAGAIALTSNYTGCACNGTSWIKLADATACVW